MNALDQSLAIGQKDVRTYYTKPPLITWALLFPAVLMLAIYFKDPEGYLSVAPGIVAMTLLFGCTSMAAIAVTFEKRTGTLRRLLLAPVSFQSIVLGKTGGALVYGLATACLLTLGLVGFWGMPLARPDIFLLGLVLGGAVFSLLGIWASAVVKEVFEAMTLMNFFRLPLLFISGVFMPMDNFPAWLAPVAAVSPLTHTVELLRLGAFGSSGYLPAWFSLLLLVAYALGSWWVAVRAFRLRAAK